MVRAYSAFATANSTSGTGSLGLRAETLEALTGPLAPVGSALASGWRDKVLLEEVSFSLGYLRPCDRYPFGSSPRAFGSPGAGGSFAFADPDAGVGFAYAPNRMGLALLGDPREMALREALYRCL
jgi:CubicO group peptidase (beta-lactamase class C family)